MTKESVAITLGYMFVARPILKLLARMTKTDIDDDAIYVMDKLLGVDK